MMKIKNKEIDKSSKRYQKSESRKRRITNDIK